MLAIDDVTMITGMAVRPVVAAYDDIHRLSVRLGNDLPDLSADDDGRRQRGRPHRGPRQRRHRPRRRRRRRRSSSWSTRVLKRAIRRGASDIHFDPSSEDMHVIFRVDGMLDSAVTIPRRMSVGVVSRMKVMANLDIAERRTPQDGRVSLLIDGHEIDLRIVTLPTVYGEAIVARILDSSSRPGRPGADRDARRRPRQRRGRDGAPVRRRARHRPDRLGQVHHLVLVPGARQQRHAHDRHRRGPGRVPDGRRQADGHQQQGEDDVRRRVEGDHARRPGHHHGRRDPRRRDRAHRGRGGADRPPRALHAAHARRAERGLAPARHGRRAVPALRARSTASSPSAWRASSATTARGPCASRRTSCTTTASRSTAPVEIFKPGGCDRCNQTGYRGRLGIFEILHHERGDPRADPQALLGRRDRHGRRRARA